DRRVLECRAEARLAGNKRGLAGGELGGHIREGGTQLTQLAGCLIEGRIRFEVTRGNQPGGAGQATDGPAPQKKAGQHQEQCHSSDEPKPSPEPVAEDGVGRLRDVFLVDAKPQGETRLGFVAQRGLYEKQVAGESMFSRAGAAVATGR